jgi:hypothetical protein
MPVLARARLPTMEAPPPAHDASEGYRALMSAVVRQAVLDARGTVFAPGPHSPRQLQDDARAWLQDEAAVQALVELGGYNAEPVLHRVRQRLHEDECPVVVSEQQLSLLADRSLQKGHHVHARRTNR